MPPYVLFWSRVCVTLYRNMYTKKALFIGNNHITKIKRACQVDLYYFIYDHEVIDKR